MEEERKRILDAAVTEFSENGVKAASLKAISEHANLEEGIVRALFIDKQGLYRELLKEIAGPLISASSFVAEDADSPYEYLRKSLQLYDRWLLENPQFVRLFAWGIAEEIPFFDSVYSHVFYPSEFSDKLQSFIANGSITVNDENMVFMLIESMMIFGHLLRANIGKLNPEKTEEEIFEARFKAMMAILESGLFNSKE